MTKTNQIRAPRDKPLKQNIRVWFNYLQTAIKWNGKIDPNSKTKEVFNFPINKEYYRAWHLSQVRTLKFDKCVKARFITKTINPEECASFEIGEILVDTLDINEKIKIVAPDVD